MKKLNLSIPNLIKNITEKKLKNIPNKSFIAIQHNKLIEAKYSMSVQQKRIIIWLASKIKPEDEDFKKHQLSTRELIEMCNLSGESAYKEIKKITFSLVEKGIRIIDITKPNEDKEIQISWLLSAKYDNGIVKLNFNPELKPYLLKLKNSFTAVNTHDLMQFKSIHAIRIYELLKQYENIGERIMEIEEIKKYCGIGEKLSRYSDFEKRILLISQREINNKSDIKIEFERIKHSRKIVAIKFIIRKNKAYALSNNTVKQIQDMRRRPPVYDILKEFGLSTKMVNTVIKNHDEQYLHNAIRAVDIQLEKKQVRNTKAMILTAIKEGWNPNKYLKR